MYSCSFCNFSYPCETHLKMCHVCEVKVCLSCSSHSTLKSKPLGKLVTAADEVTYEVCPYCCKPLNSEKAAVLTLDSKEKLASLREQSCLQPRQIVVECKPDIDMKEMLKEIKSFGPIAHREY